MQINERIVITGDLNSDLLISNNNKLIDTLNLFNLNNVIEKPTRVTDHSCTLLDPIIISDALLCTFSDVLKTPRDISDHDAPVAFIECPVSASRTFTREIWLYDRADKSKFSQKLQEVDWNALLPDEKDVDDLCEIFTVTFLNIARDCIPTKLVTIRKSDKPWFKNELRKEIRKRNRLRNKAIKSQKTADLVKYKKTAKQGQ